MRWFVVCSKFTRTHGPFSLCFLNLRDSLFMERRRWKNRHGKRMTRKGRKKKLWQLGCSVVILLPELSISQPFEFAFLFWSKFSPLYVLLKLLAILMLLCFLPSDRSVHDNKKMCLRLFWACLTAVCLIIPYSVIVHACFLTEVQLPPAKYQEHV